MVNQHLFTVASMNFFNIDKPRPAVDGSIIFEYKYQPIQDPVNPKYSFFSDVEPAHTVSNIFDYLHINNLTNLTYSYSALLFMVLNYLME